MSLCLNLGGAEERVAENTASTGPRLGSERPLQLSSCGLYKTVRRVIDQVDDYYMGTEYLECGKCHRKLPAWSKEILEQLDICNRLRFPAVLSYHLALDRRVVAELRDRSLGNSATRLYLKLSELHYHDYMERVLKWVYVDF